MTFRVFLAIGLALAAVTSLTACVAPSEDRATPGTAAADGTRLTLPDLEAIDDGGRPLQVVATTSIIGDVVGRVGGSGIALTVLQGAGQDPHGYVASPADLAAAAAADAIFITGWNLEEGLLTDLAAAAPAVPQVPVSAGITPRLIAELNGQDEAGDEEHPPGAPDPHTWLDPHLMILWVENIEATLEALDPVRAAEYAANAGRFRGEIDELIAAYDARLAPIDPAKRKLVTDHDALGYFARAYDFKVVGTVIPGASTMAEPSARELAGLAETMQREGVCAIFSDTTVPEGLAQVVAAELSTCDEVRIVPLYTGSLGAAGSGADTYVGMMEANLEAIATTIESGE
jgi:ABC-type Zn uptake system ZnuABC Zn-binding protein ZnuA